MAPVATLLISLLALSGSTSALPAEAPSRRGNRLGALGRFIERYYYGDEYGLSRPPPLIERRDTLPAGWSYAGCVSEAHGVRLLQGFEFYSPITTPVMCIQNCAARGFAIAGMEFATECYCANEVTSNAGGGILYADSTCNMPCQGDKSQKCGAAWYLSLYKYTAPASHLDGANGNCSAAAPSSAPPANSDPANRVNPNGPNGVTPVVPVPTTTAATQTSPTTTATTHTSPTTTATTQTSPTTTAATQTTTTGTGTNAAAPIPTNVPASNEPHSVWAHHMVGLTYSYTRSDWAADISDAIPYGIDGFALNMGTDSWQPQRVSDAYAAAESSGKMKMFLSFDMTSLPCNSPGDASRLVSLVQAHAKSPAQAKFGGKVLVSTFAGGYCMFGTGNSNAWQTLFIAPLARAGVDVFFVPASFLDTSAFPSLEWLDGDFNWNGAWPMGNTDISTLASDASYTSALAQGNKAYMASVSPFFYTHFGPQSYNKNWLYRSDDWLYCTRWEDIIRLRDTTSMTEIVTWNDFGESSYVGPLRGAMPGNSAEWVNGFQHTGLKALTAYYSAAFKTGAYPAIQKDSITIWSRPHPALATASNDPTPRPTNFDWTSDFLWAAVLTTGPATVTLTSGSTSQTFQVQGGLTKLKLASAPGGIGGSITRDGKVTAQYASGNAFQYTLTPQKYNYNYFVGASS